MDNNSNNHPIEIEIFCVDGDLANDSPGPSRKKMKGKTRTMNNKKTSKIKYFLMQLFLPKAYIFTNNIPWSQEYMNILSDIYRLFQPPTRL